MYWYENLCVPETVTGRVIRAHQAEIGHVGGKIVERNTEMVSFRTTYTSRKVGRNNTWAVRNLSSTQSDEHTFERDNWAVYRATNVRRKCEYWHIRYAECNLEWRSFQCHAVCFDRGSGWHIAVPQQRKGLTAKKSRTCDVRNCWEPFGVPSIITSDRGTQFAAWSVFAGVSPSSWWSCRGNRREFCRKSRTNWMRIGLNCYHWSETKCMKYQARQGYHRMK